MVRNALFTLVFILGFGNKLSAQLSSGLFDKQAIQQANTSAVNVKNSYSILTEGKLTALVFFSTECPLSQNYSVVVQKISDDFSKNVQVFGLFPGTTYSKREIREFSNKYKVRFPLIIDKKMKMVKLVNATITPEVILLDDQANLIYRGAIDDWAIDLGKKRSKAATEFLREAIQHKIAGLPVSPKITRPVGCLINEY